MAIDWSYADPVAPTADEILKELNGKALADLKDAEGKVTRKAGEQLASFGEMKDDGSTDGVQWIYTGVYGPKGNFSQRRDNADPSGLGVYGSWAFAWPANRRILYNRASADPSGKPWSEAKAYTYWDAAEKKWTGPDVPDFVADQRPGERVRPVHHEPGGRVAPLGARHDDRRPVPGALRAVRGAGGEPALPQGPGQPGGAGVRQRLRDLRRRRRVPDRGHHLPADRALPLLDQERPDQRGAAAGVVHRALAGAGGREGHPAGADGADSGRTAAR